MARKSKKNESTIVEAEKIPAYFVEPPKAKEKNKFEIRNGRVYKKINEYTGIYTDTGEVFKLR